jgi:hypothetical protein
MPTQACPHCRSMDVAWFRTFTEWIATVDAHCIEYDSQAAHEMMTTEPSVYWLCTNCGQGGMAVGEGAALGTPAGEGGPAIMVTAAVKVRGGNHLVAAHTADYARQNCTDYRKAADMIRPDIVALREKAGLDKDGGNDDAFRALAEQATDGWRETARSTLAQAMIGDLPGALRMAVCFTHAFADVLWDELGESADDAYGADDQARLDILVAMWTELNGSKANKPVSRKAKQKAEAKLRAAVNRRK